LATAQARRPALSWLNYHHLLYFYTTAREGSISKAATVLHLTQPTISAQIRALEDALAERLFERRGRGLALTEAGHLVYRYAEEIFGLGRELQGMLAGQPGGRPLRLRVGVADGLPKLIVYRLLEPAFRSAEPVHLVCREGTPDRLLAELSIHRLDVVLLDAPPAPGTTVRVFSHLLGESGVTLFGTLELARRYRRRFPTSLDGAPMLLPSPDSTLRSSLDQWLAQEEIRPVVTGEFSDSAVLKVFGGAGAGVFAAPSVVEDEVRRQHNVRVIGRIPSIRERFYAVSAERRLRHPAVAAISQAARAELFG
jgi:LysR family transcriptional regulator, transcriptional activator of nhaA